MRRASLRTGLLSLAILTAVAPAVAQPTPDDAARLFRRGQYPESAAAAATALERSPFNESLWVLKIRAELEQGRHADALASLNAGMRAAPSSVQLRWIGRDVHRFNGDPEQALKLDEEIGNLARQSPWRYSDSPNQVTIGRFLLSHGVDPRRVLSEVFGLVKRRNAAFTDVYLASGELALEKHDYALAAKEFEQAATLQPDDPDAQFGLVRAFAESDEQRTQAAYAKTLELNPRHVRALLWMADRHIDAERYVEAEALLAEVARVNPRQPLAAAYRAVLAHLKYDLDAERQLREEALRDWSTNPEVDHLIGRKLSQKYRFAEGAESQRRALRMDPGHVPAKLQLAQDLLRLGREEGWALAAEVNSADEYNIVAHNLVTLQESIAGFRTLESDGLILRMDAREADIYGGQVLDLLQRARAELCERYEVELEGPIIVEMFPRQQDFAIRTFGLPGGAGFLGVCFGAVITANSPAALGEITASWEATLWHEFCHVVTLNKTRNRMPRWLSEGISVYEETRKDRTWGQALTPQYRQMLLGDDFVPLTGLSGAFLQARSSQHLQFAYFESALAVEFLVERFGLEALKQVLDDLGNGLSINDALERRGGPLEALDAEFAAYARERANSLAPGADWSEPELPRRADLAAVEAWVRDHPANYRGLQRLARERIAAGDWVGAKEPLERMRELFPADASAEGPYPLLARVFRELGENPSEREVLESLLALTSSQVGVFARLSEMAAAEGDWELCRTIARRWLAVNPLQPAPHRLAIRAADALLDDELAANSCRALLALEAIDSAGLRLRLASALERSGQLPAARREVLLALEEAPRDRAAYRQLNSILEQLHAPASQSTAEPAAEQGLSPPPPPLPVLPSRSRADF
ncbi:MAG: hypothetical protein KF774_06325 [Planctomyces sp.]|nr:hypothetical protein [Planctomyces sp.]